MLDIQFIRDNPKLVAEKSKQKGYKVDIEKLLDSDKQRQELLSNLMDHQRARNDLTKSSKGQRPSDDQIKKGQVLRETITKEEEKLRKIDQEFTTQLASVPNMPLDDVPVGASEAENKVIKTWGEPREFDFAVKSDAELGEARDMIDKTRAAKVSAARFTYLKGGLVELEFAITQWVLKTLGDERLIERLITQNNLSLVAKAFVPVLPPAVANTATYMATGRLNGEDETYKLADDDLWLNASAEHILAPMYLEEILPEDQLPIRYVGFTTAFRREAGSYGKDTEGIFRMHQFDKLEMEVFSAPETGLDEHRLLVAIQEHLVQQLGLPYQLLLKCTADIGKPNARGIDINTWMPAQKQYRETHTADFIADYQARRMKTRLRRQDGGIELVHTNDATAFAMGRIIKAIMENYQTHDGHIIIPDVLRPFMSGKTEI
ncbi:MAG TPA: serine--tRNA ligase [Candidatus Saccharimonadales bacterium]|nr:serine--tRNA ligase [Candidatus Saccharimonadales bacterium]